MPDALESQTQKTLSWMLVESEESGKGAAIGWVPRYTYINGSTQLSDKNLRRMYANTDSHTSSATNREAQHRRQRPEPTLSTLIGVSRTDCTTLPRVLRYRSHEWPIGHDLEDSDLQFSLSLGWFNNRGARKQVELSIKESQSSRKSK